MSKKSHGNKEARKPKRATPAQTAPDAATPPQALMSLPKLPRRK